VTPQVRVFYTTPPFFDYVWAARKGSILPLSKRSQDAMLLALDAGNAEQKTILELLNASKYVRAERFQLWASAASGEKNAGLLK